MCFILGIETSGDTLSLAISKESTILRSLDLHMEQSHARQIWSLTDGLLRSAGVSANEIGLIAVGKGPGSYTGIRIGTAFAKGWAFAEKTPVVSIGTLENMYAQIAGQQAFSAVHISLDARRNELFRAFWGEDGMLLKAPAAVVLEEESYLENLWQKPISLLGSGALKTHRFFGEPSSWQIFDHLFANAETCCKLGWQKFQEGDLQELELFEPAYLKPVYITRKNNA